MLAALLSFAAMCANPTGGVVIDHVDLVQIFHLTEPDGTPWSDMVIFWRFNLRESRYEVIAWRFANNPAERSVLPTYDHRLNRWVCRWFDTWKPDADRMIFREVRAISFREDTRPNDPEVGDRVFLPPKLRAGLTGQTSEKGEGIRHVGQAL